MSSSDLDLTGYVHDPVLGLVTCERVWERGRDYPTKRKRRFWHRDPEFHVSIPVRCECGAVVRLIGPKMVRGSWLCPVCGVAKPYTFWKVRKEAGTRVVCLDELVIALGDDACPECGEENECRCVRIALARKDSR